MDKTLHHFVPDSSPFYVVEQQTRAECLFPRYYLARGLNLAVVPYTLVTRFSKVYFVSPQELERRKFEEEVTFFFPLGAGVKHFCAGVIYAWH